MRSTASKTVCCLVCLSTLSGNCHSAPWETSIAIMRNTAYVAIATITKDVRMNNRKTERVGWRGTGREIRYHAYLNICWYLRVSPSHSTTSYMGRERSYTTLLHSISHIQSHRIQYHIEYNMNNYKTREDKTSRVKKLFRWVIFTRGMSSKQ